MERIIFSYSFLCFILYMPKGTIQLKKCRSTPEIKILSVKIQSLLIDKFNIHFILFVSFIKHTMYVLGDL